MSFLDRSSHELAEADLRQSLLSCHSRIRTPLISLRPTASSRYMFRCTRCLKAFPLPCFTVGNRLRAVCRDCRGWMWSLGICWSCGEVVSRKTDAIGFGLWWWHWGCLSCLVCSFPLRPPRYFDSTDQPHEKGIMLNDAPICDRCIESPEPVAKVEPHVSRWRRVPPTTHKESTDPSATGTVQPTAQISNKRAPIQIEVGGKQPLSLQYALQPVHHARPLPAWMSLLPSNVNPHVKPPTQSIISGR